MDNENDKQKPVLRVMEGRKSGKDKAMKGDPAKGIEDMDEWPPLHEEEMRLSPDWKEV